MRYYNLQHSSRFRISIALILFFAITLSVHAQIKEEVATTIRKQTVNVKNIEKKSESPVPPVISQGTKETIQYTIIDMPADSDFEPSPLPPNKIKNLPQEKLYDNYIEGGFGNLTHFWLDMYANYKLESDRRIGIRLNHNSTAHLKDFPYNVSTNFADTKAELFFESPLKAGKLHTDVNFGQNKYNLYGSTFPKLYFNDSIETNVEQNLTTFGAKATYQTFENKFFNTASFNANYLKDKYGSRELDFGIKATLDKTGYEASIFNHEFDLGGELPMHIDYTQSKFGVDSAQSYNYFKFGISPAAKLLGKNYDIKIGAKIDYLSSNFKEYSKFYFFPRLEIEYNGLEAFKLFVGVKGGLDMNSYQKLLQENRYLYPDENLFPTETKYDIFGGIKGTINEQFLYFAKLSYSKNKNILFYEKRADTIEVATEAYNRFNTLQAVYDNGTIIGVNASLQYIQIENLNLALVLDYKGYSLDNYDKILNRPNISAQINGSYKFLEDKLTLGSQFFIVGGRKTNDFSYDNSSMPPLLLENEVDLKSYFDLNITADYQFKPYLNFFLKGINLLNAENEIYVHYPMQGFQVLGGVLFKF